MEAHLAPKMGYYFIAILQLNAEHRIWQGLGNGALFNDFVFLSIHALAYSTMLL